MPLDMAKTRLQNQKDLQYKGTLDVLVKVASTEGVLALWKGFLPYWLRLGNHTIIVRWGLGRVLTVQTFILLEHFNKMLKEHFA